MVKKIVSAFAAVILTVGCLSSCSEKVDSMKESESSNYSESSLIINSEVPETNNEMTTTTRKTSAATSTTTKETTTTTTTPKATTTTAKPAEKPVPAIIKSLLVEFNNSLGFDRSFMAYSREYGFNGDAQDEMWFQDIDGDNKPDLVLGGHAAVTPKTGQGQSHCFCLYLSSGVKSDYLEFKPDYDHKGKYGHNAFVLQAYKGTDGKVFFTQTQFHAYTSGEHPDPRYAGTFGLFKYDFNNGKTEADKVEMLHYSYDTRQGSGLNAFSFSNGNGQEYTPQQAKKIYNNLYNGAAPLRANIKAINYKQFLKLDHNQRQKALMDSYYAFSYSADKSIKPYANELFNKI